MRSPHMAPSTLVPFEQVVQQHGAVVLRVCRAVAGPADADDAWSETFLSALRAYPTLRPESNVRGWLVTIAHHRSIDLVRRRRSVPLAPHDDRFESPTDGTGPGRLDDRLVASLLELTERQRSAVALRYLGDLDYRDVAELLGCSVDAARRSAADGIARLRQHLPEGSPT